MFTGFIISYPYQPLVIAISYNELSLTEDGECHPLSVCFIIYLRSTVNSSTLLVTSASNASGAASVASGAW